MRKFVGAVGAAAVVVMLIVLIVYLAHWSPTGARQVAPAPVPPPAPTAATMDHTDWHIADRLYEVKWIGGHCYSRARDGSTLTSSGAEGLVAVGEKYCILYSAK